MLKIFNVSTGTETNTKLIEHEMESYHIDAETKWLPFSRQNFHVHFLENV